MPKFPGHPILTILHAIFHGAIVIAEENSSVVYVNPCLQRWIGWAEDELPANALEIAFDADSLARVRDLIDDVRGRSEPVEAEAIGLRALEETHRLVDVRAFRTELPEGGVIVLLLGDRTALQVEAAALARRDSLTGLADREFVLARIEASLQGIRARDREFAVLFIDLDNFKYVNDSYGHLLGDRVLREAARRLAGCVRENDVVARFGGDEFIVLVDRVAEQVEVQPIIDRIHASMAVPIALPEGEVVLSLSIGVALPSPAHRSAEDLIAEADRAMYAAKRARV